ncbi:MAG: nucleoside recognition domain-containing protein, partial [Angelakisella sp.]
IDRELLQSHLGVPVVCTCAQKEHGLSTLMDAVLALLEQPVVHRSPALPMPCPPVADPEQQSAVDAAALRQAVHHVLRDCVVRQCSDRTQCQSRLDRLLTSRLTGIPVMLLLLLAVLWLTITGANYPSQLLAQWLFGLEQPLVQVLAVLGAPPWLRGLLVEGCWRVLAWVVSVMLPPMAIFFPLFTLLEDLGYLPRAAFNLDHLFQRCHACGKQCLTLCMGLGCNAAGVTGCRIIDSPRERLIAILTNSFIPCNGRFPTLVTLIGLFWATGEGGSVSAAVLLTLTIG